MVAMGNENAEKEGVGAGSCCRLSLKYRRVMCFLTGCLCSILSGSMLAFNVYSIDLKDAFKITQTQVELIAGVIMVCANIGYPIGLLYERFGPAACYALSAALGFVSCFMIYWATFDHNYFTEHFWLLALFYGIYGFATLPLYVISMTVNMGNFKSNFRGRVVGTTGAFWWLGPAVFSAIYNNIFVVYSANPFRQYFLMLAVSFLVVCILAIIFIRSVPLDYEEIAGGSAGSKAILEGNQSESVDLEMEAVEQSLLPDKEREPVNTVNEADVETRKKCVDGTVPSSDEQQPLVARDEQPAVDDNKEPCSVVIEETLFERIGLDLLANGDFHLLSWSFLCVCSVELMLVANVAIFADSYQMDDLIDILTIVSPLCAAASKFSIGIISDCLLRVLPRTSFILIGTILQSFLALIAIFQGDDKGVFVMLIIISYVTNGIFFAITPTLLSEMFGLYHFSRNWGVELLLVSLLDLVLLQIFGGLYSQNTDAAHATYCTGQNCFRGIYIISFLMTSIGLPLLMVLYKHEKATRKNDRKS